ncbi:MAG: phosphodiester glycosidase family protein [Vicinamibacterales bacterium]
MFRAVGAAVVAVVLALQPAPPAAPSAARRVVDAYDGIRYLELVETAPRPLRLHVARIDLTAPGLRVTVSPPAGAREAVRETTLDFVRRSGAQWGVNAHFFLPFPSDDTDAWVIGLAASEGRVYSAFETPEQSFALVPDAPALRFDRRQRARIVHRARGDADGRRVRERGAIWNAVAGSAQILTDGAVTIPTYRSAANPGGVLLPGLGGRYDAGRSWYDVYTARTAAGLSKDRRVLTLVVVERSPASDGLPVGDLAHRMRRDFGVWNALNLDGGGSSTMVWQDPATGVHALLNTSADTPAGRRVATSLAIFARPLREP